MNTADPNIPLLAQSIDSMRLHLALEAAHAGIWEADIKTGRNIWSEEVWTLYGLMPGSVEPSTETWQATVHPAQRACVIERVTSAVAQGQPFDAEWRVNRDDHERWLYSRGGPVLDAEGQVVSYIGIVMDITERKLAMQARIQREQQLQTVLDSLPVMVAWVDNKLLYRYVNKLYSQTFNRQPDQIIGQPIDKVIDQHAVARAQPYIERVLQGETVTFENMLTFADGEHRELRLTFVPDRGVQGDIDGYFSIGVDLSRERKLDAEHERLVGELDKVGRRQIAQQVAAAVAHEINQPLHAAATFCETARRMITQDYQAESTIHALTRAGEELARAGEILKHLLDSLRDCSPLTHVMVTDLNHAAVRSVRRYHSDRLPERSCVTSELTHLPLPVKMNVIAIEKVVINLLRNACMAMINGIGPCGEHCRIRVSTARLGDMAQLCVQDNGPGVTEEQRKTLFQPSLTKVKACGLGFGLAICRQLVELHGGRIWHEPTPGGGATFCIALPLVPQGVQE